MWLSPYLAIEKKAGCSKSNDITKYFSITPQPLGRKSLISEQAKEKPKMAPCHIGGSYDEVPLSVSRSTSRLHRFKQNRYPEARTSLIKDGSCSDPPNNVIVISESSCSSADTAFRGRAVMGSVDLAHVTGKCHGAGVGLGSGQSEIACNLTIQTAVQSASGTTRTSDEKVATIFTRKRDTNKANSPQHSQRWILNWCSRSTLKHNQTERKGSITSGWREKLSGTARKGSLEEVKLSNPLFPVRRVFTMLLKKYKHKILESESPEYRGALALSLIGICHRFLKYVPLFFCCEVHNIEDLLWTDKYCPQHSSEVIGNSVSVKKLHSWLKKWKRRADCEERRKERDRKLEENANNSWDCGDFQGETRVEEDGEEDLCSTMLITGPPGVGKTASVYACAQELGFKVFEVNASSQRSGRHILTQLKEATQSHLVEIQGSTTFKPSHLSSYNNTSTKSDTVAGKVASPKKVFSSYRKRPQPPRSSHHKRGGSAASMMLANFFKKKSNPEITNLDGPSLSTKQDDDRAVPALPQVDVVFDDDVGFLTAIKTFMTTTKRPVILTTSDPSFKAKFDGNFEAILFKNPSVVNVCSYLQLLCLAENVRMDAGDITSLVTLNQIDIRRSLLQLQLWVCSGGGQASQRATPLKDPAGVALLYSNLELLLPLPVRTQLQSEPTPPDIHHPQIPLILDQTSPVKVSSGSRLRRKKCVPTSDSRSAHSMLVKPYRASLSLRRAHPSVSNITETVNDKLQTEKAADGLVYHCLDAMTDFMDLMSFIDTSLQSESSHKAGPCRPGAFLWTGAEVKDGLLDEMREEDGGCRWWCERTLEIQAAVEGLGFHRCLARVSEGWTGSQRLEGDSSSIESVWYLNSSLSSSVVERRYDIIRTVLSSRAFCTLGNKQAVAVDYLPVLRTMCQSERNQQGQGRSIHLGLPKATVRLLADDFP
uniref:ATPase family AAA domain containing 5b n=1 Tax=Oncorhynchus kisutch TaxID=8019 RepID=A0A8C7F1D7_ONCKI